MAHLTTIEARTLAAAGQAFGLNFTDPLNAPAAEHEIPADPDGEYNGLQANTYSYLLSHVPENQVGRGYRSLARRRCSRRVTVAGRLQNGQQ